ncbi:hypothetical protein PoB_002496100 [Plakobranchus ocellatus]|uniref:BESS domain-containing protein n=1 Tax=Plakobranchus ocellatus TaxID=259542 RepID=A0AAV3ZVA4_9GAST|nr:hypothetical protein PoB_002496100 [Plakobranchus ocellatus]
MNKKRSFDERRDEIISFVCKRLQGDESNDETMSTVMAWGHELKQMKEDQKLFAKNRNSVQINAVAQHSLVHRPFSQPLPSACSLSTASY